MRHFDPDPGFNENVENHEFPRFGRFVRRNDPDPGAIMTQNVFLVISVQQILYQLPYGAKQKWDFFFAIYFYKYA